jgi:hypothetical protein
MASIAGSPNTIKPPPGITSDIGANFTLALGNETFDAEWTRHFILPNSTENQVSKLHVGFASSMLWSLHDDGTAEGLVTAPEREIAEDIEPWLESFVIVAGLASATKTNKIVKVKGVKPNNQPGVVNASFWDVQFDGVVAFCTQVLEVVETDITVNWPNMTISIASPPVPNEQTARPIRKDDGNSSAYFKPANARSGRSTADWFGISTNNFLWTLQENVDTAETLNAWFPTLETMPGGQPLSELLGYKNQDKLLAASSKLYGHYAAQAINANMRSTAAQPGQSLASYNATITGPTLRLRQNKGPKIVLQVLLGVMVLCAAAAYLLADTKELVRQSPGSIIGRMELLLWSELCNSETMIPKGAEWWTDKERKERGLFEGWTFSLGWWGTPDTRWYGVDVGKAEKVM